MNRMRGGQSKGQTTAIAALLFPGSGQGVTRTLMASGKVSVGGLRKSSEKLVAAKLIALKSKLLK